MPILQALRIRRTPSDSLSTSPDAAAWLCAYPWAHTWYRMSLPCTRQALGTSPTFYAASCSPCSRGTYGQQQVSQQEPLSSWRLPPLDMETPPSASTYCTCDVPSMPT